MMMSHDFWLCALLVQQNSTCGSLQNVDAKGSALHAAHKSETTVDLYNWKQCYCASGLNSNQKGFLCGGV